MKIFKNEDFIIDYLDGNCPVQGEGSYKGYKWYFRSRWDNWSLTVSSQKQLDPLADKKAFFYSELWGEQPGEAGWMPKETAIEMINKAFVSYLDKKVE
jgi:hypothetical protein